MRRRLQREAHGHFHAAEDAHRRLLGLLATFLLSIFVATLAYLLFFNRSVTRPLRTAISQTERALRESEAHFRDTFLQCGFGFHTATIDGRILQVNDRFCEITGYTRDELLKLSIHDTQIPADVPASRAAREKLVREPTPVVHRERQLVRKDGSIIWVSNGLSVVRDEQGNPLHFMSVTQDITQKMLSERRIEQLATRDTLTGLCNRSAFIEQLQFAITQAQRAETRFVVMFIDLDKFKTINDSLGHDAGDQVLRECAKRLTACVREFDTVARFGGDEFVVLLNHVADEQVASVVAQRMLRQLQAPYTLDGRDWLTTASIGIALYPGDGLDATALMKNADIAMYHAKSQHRNNYQFYAPEMNERMQRRLQLERELRAALQNGEFILHYQPQVVVATGEVCGVESLVRWHHPTLGVLSPAEFIPVAEDSGLIVPIGEWVLNHACATVKSWQMSNVDVPYIVVNVSPGQLSEGLVKLVMNALVNHGIAPGWLMLEITETMLMERVDEAISILSRIRDLGVRIAMDDFGTGYSSLSVLQRLPLDTIKIDRSFISAIGTKGEGARASVIIGAIIAIAKELGLKVVAEGVETTDQLAYLRNLNCDVYQGYLYSKAVDTMMLEAKLASPKTSTLLDPDGRAITTTLKVSLDLPFDQAQPAATSSKRQA